jgi:hypothetical protein
MLLLPRTITSQVKLTDYREGRFSFSLPKMLPLPGAITSQVNKIVFTYLNIAQPQSNMEWSRHINNKFSLPKCLFKAMHISTGTTKNCLKLFTKMLKSHDFLAVYCIKKVQYLPLHNNKKDIKLKKIISYFQLRDTVQQCTSALAQKIV